MDEFTFLSKEQVIGKNQLEIFKKYGVEAVITDFSILLGGIVDSEKCIKINDEIIGTWWTNTKDEKDNREIVNITTTEINDKDSDYEKYGCGARPAISYSSIKKDEFRILYDINKIKEIEYGEYPQTIVDSELSKKLEKLYFTKLLKKTGKVYTTDRINFVILCEFSKKEHIEYEYKGKKYIRVLGKKYFSKKQILSNGEVIKDRKAYWVKVEPIKWIIDEKEDIAISKKILFSGIYYSHYYNFYEKEDNFDEPFIKQFMREYFAKDIIPSNNKLIIKESVIKNDFQEKITNILKEIEENYLNIQNKDNIKNKINHLLEDYNKKLEDLKNSKDLTLYNEDNLKKELEINLNIILDILKKYYQNNKSYYQILNDLDIIIEMFNKEDRNNKILDRDIIKDFDIIINYCMPFLKKEETEKIKTDLLKILITEKNKIIKYLESIETFDDNFLLKQTEKLDYSNYKEFELTIRKKIHYILIELNAKVNKRNIELEINEGIKQITENLYKESEEKMLHLYLKEINKLKEEIEISILKIKENREIYKFKLRKILLKEIKYEEKEVTEILKDVNDIIISLNKLNNEITEKISTENLYINNRLNIRLK